MLSVFITPWQKPTDCQSAISSAVRRVTSRSRLVTDAFGSAGSPARVSRHSG